MSNTSNTSNTNNEKSNPRLDVISTRSDERLLKLKKARKLIGKVIQKDGQDFGKIVEIVTIGDKIVAVTKKYRYNPGEMEIDVTSFKIDVASIFRVLARNNGSEKHYPDGSSYSRRVMRTPKSKGRGRALTGKHGIDDTQIAYYEKYYKKGYKTS